ncbi:MAG: hypothetical protein AAGI14_01585 [Pseudomonadota bacterium]
MIRKTISMPDEMGDWIIRRLTDGQFNNESEYVRDLIRKDQAEQEQLAYLRARLQQGEEQIAQNKVTMLQNDKDVSDFFDEIDAEPLD